MYNILHRKKSKRLGKEKEMPKSMNISPRRKFMALQLPKVELNSIGEFSIDLHKTWSGVKPKTRQCVSMSIECVKSKSSNLQRNSQINNNYIKNNQKGKEAKKNSFEYEEESIWKIKATEKVRLRKIADIPRSIWRNSNKYFADLDISVKGEGKSRKCSCASSPSEKMTIFQEMKSFKENVDAKYKSLYDQIDLNHKGIFTHDDIMNFLIHTGLQSGTVNNEPSYLDLKEKTHEIFLTFSQVSMKNCISHMDFFAVCAAYENNFPDFPITGIFVLENLQKLRSSIVGLKEIFRFYSKNKYIENQELKTIMAYFNLEELGLINSMIRAKRINFARFLRFLPLFLWMHKEVMNHIDLGKSQT